MAGCMAALGTAALLSWPVALKAQWTLDGGCPWLAGCIKGTSECSISGRERVWAEMVLTRSCTQ